MPINVRIDPSSQIPAYRQIIEQIVSKVRAGELKAGDRLPAARDLAPLLGIARGTIAKAYEELARCSILDVTPGRGSFVSARQDVVPESRCERAARSIAEFTERGSRLIPFDCQIERGSLIYLEERIRSLKDK